MMGSKHLLFGAGAWLGVSAMTGYTPGLLETTAVLLGSLAPDLDHPRSKIGRLAPPLSHFFYRYGGGHRGMTHSALMLIPLLWLTWYFWNQHLLSSDHWLSWLTGIPQIEATSFGLLSAIVFAFTFGYVTHLVGDLLTRQGLKFLWPLPFVLRLTPFKANSLPISAIAWLTLIAGLLAQAWVLFNTSFHNLLQF